MTVEANPLAETPRSALSQAEERWRLTLDHSPLGMALVSPAGAFLRVNPALCEIVGHSAEILIGLTFQDITHPEDLEMDLALVDECLLGQRTSYRLLKRYLHADGRQVWVEISVALVRDEDDVPLHFVVHVEDVGEQMVAQAQVQALVSELAARTAELQRSNGELEHFAAVASHDLRSPLSVISGYLELLAADHGDTLDARGRGYLDRAQDAAGRMMGLLDALLGYARLDGDVLRRSPVDVDLLLDEVLADLSADAGQLAAHVVRRIAPGGLHADPELVRQLLQNLVANAVKYRAPERALEILVELEPSSGDWCLSVVDNGRGIAPDLIERAFDMFTRDEADPTPGAGIGLATCRRIVARHGGRIWAEPVVGGGTAVRCLLPGRRVLA